MLTFKQVNSSKSPQPIEWLIENSLGNILALPSYI